MAISPAFIQDLLARCDVVDVVGQYVQLKKTGASYQGLCPFHNEKTPSFSVSPSKQFYYCFGCGKSGDAIRFLMESQGLGFFEAVKQLAGTLGIAVPEDTRTPVQREAARERKQQGQSLNQVLQCAAQHWQRILKASKQARTYLEQRGLSGTVIQRYGLGFAPAGWHSLEQAFPDDYNNPLLAQAGLVVERRAEDGQGETKRYDRFRERIVFPIRNVAGEYIGFGGRVLNKEEPKYLNSPETAVFSKGRELYGLLEARASLAKAGYALVTEGYMDVVALAQHGFANAVATLGTACTSEHIHKLFRFTEKIVFAFDGDAAGQNAARKALQMALPHASDKRSVYFLFLPAEHDPDSYIRALGSDAFARLVETALPLSQMLLRVAREACNLDTVEGRSRLATQAQPLWLPLSDGVGKHQILREIAQLVQLGEHELLNLWGKGRPKNHGPNYAQSSMQRKARAPGGSRRGSTARGFGSTFDLNPRRPIAARQPPTSRIERALGILFGNAGFWDALGMDDKSMLVHWSAPIGPLFAWLDQQELEHGVQAWSALRLSLAEYANADDYRMALKAVATAGLDETSEHTELQDILQRLRQDHKKERLQALAQEAMSDPQKYAEYKRLLAQ